MKSMHDELFVPSAVFLKKYSTITRKRIEPIRAKIIEKISQDLKSNNPFINMPFLWLRTAEYYGDFDEIKVEVKKIDKKYGDIGVDISIPLDSLKELKEKSDEEVEAFFTDICMRCITAVVEKYKK